MEAKLHQAEIEKATLADINEKLDQSNNDLIGRTNRLYYESVASNEVLYPGGDDSDGY